MEIVLKDGSVLKCDTAEALRLKSLGFFGVTAVDVAEKKVNKIPNILKQLNKLKRDRDVEVNIDVVGSNNSSVRKKFSKKEDRLIREVWGHRKNHIRLTNKEYIALQKLLPGRDRKMICRRLHRLKKHGYMK